MAHVSAFSSREIGLAAAGAALVEIALFVLLAVAGSSRTHIHAQAAPAPSEIPIAVKPVLDYAPLLKLGSKHVHYKLPDMWRKPKPVKRYEEKSAPSPLAKKTPDAIPTAPVATADAEAPPPDAALAKQVDQLIDAGPQKVANLNTKGAADGVKNGTETDPLKARAVSLYRAKIIGWFDARFRVPVGQIPCATLKTLSSAVSASVSSDRTVTGYSVARASGNALFDARVKSAMEAAKGQQVPPPPPLYPQILPPTISLYFTGKGKCK